MKILLFSYIFILTTFIHSGSLNEKISLMEQKIESDNHALISLRENIVKEREPLKNNLYEKEKELIELRFKVKEANISDFELNERFKSLKDEVKYLEGEVEFIANLLKDYRRNIVKNLSFEEEQLKSENFKKIDDSLLNTNKNELFKAAESLFSLSIDNIYQRIYSYSFKGYCLNSSGVEKEGTFFYTGPVSYFIADDLSVAGLTAFNIDKARLKIEKEFSPLILQNFEQGEQVSLPHDLTLGTANNTEKLKKNFIDHLKQGGVVIVPILVLGVVCIFVVIMKIFTLLRIGKISTANLDEIVDSIKSNNQENAINYIKQLKAPYSSVILEGYFHRNSPREHIEDLMHEKTLTEIPYLEKWLSVLAVSAAASPLLGLLGTVTGMIHTFDLITLFGTGKANLLSAGISEALVTTEFGLIIAIPALIFHAFFTRRVRHIINNIDTISIGFINKIKAE